MAEIKGDIIDRSEREHQRTERAEREQDRRDRNDQARAERVLNKISPFGVLGGTLGSVFGLPPSLGYRAGSMLQKKFGITPTGPSSTQMAGGVEGENRNMIEGWGGPQRLGDAGLSDLSEEEIAALMGGVNPYSFGGRTLAMQEDWLKYIRETGAPYISAGREGIDAQRGMLGQIMAGPDYAAARESPLFEQMRKQGEEALLAQAARTGQVGAPGTAKLMAEMEQQNLVDAAQRNYANQLAGYQAAGDLSRIGLQGMQGVAGAGGQTIGGIASTYSGMQQQDYQNQAMQMNQAALDQQRQNMYLNAGIGLLGVIANW